jgi:hypothetical protein
VTFSVEGEDTFGGGIVKDCVGIVADFDFSDELQSLDVKDRDRPFPSVADKAAAEFRRQRDAVHAGSIRDIANRLA